MREAPEAPRVAPWALWALVALLVVGCLVGGIQVLQARDERSRSEAQHARYAAASRAAAAEAEAFVNVRHDTAEADLARIAAGATGSLKDRYTQDAGKLARALARNRTITSGRVIWTGVVRVDADSATVLVATSGNRSDRGTEGPPEPRDLRLRLQLVPVRGEWLTSDIEQVD